jgi:hypothetical protein
MSSKSLASNEVMIMNAGAIGVPAKHIATRNHATDFAEWDSRRS